MTGMLVVVVFVLGLLIGSFINVVIWRVPRGESVVSPPSHCPSCGTEISPRDNVQVVSWLLLRGRCRHCGQGISARYPLVELLTAVLFAALAAWFGWTAELPAYLYLAAVGVAFRIARGVILCSLGLKMVGDDFTGSFADAAEKPGDKRTYVRRRVEQMIVPFAMPLLIGPRAISTVQRISAVAESGSSGWMV